MLRLLAVLMLAGASASSVLAAGVVIKPFGTTVFFKNDFGPSTSLPLKWYSTDALMQSNHPFPSLGHSYDSIDQVLDIINQRFTSLIGVEGTMITDYGPYGLSLPGGQLPPVESIERPFLPPNFNVIDKMLLSGLAEWTWDGSLPPLTPVLAPNYVIPAASGTFNQAEQRFYVSDGRQYQVVPEPSSLSLLLAGGAVALARRRKF